MILTRLGLLGAFVSLGAALSAHHLIFDLLSHFRIQYLFLIAIFTGAALVQKHYKSALLLALCFGVHLYALLQSQYPRAPGVVGAAPLISVMSSNLLASNDRYAQHADFIASVNPTVVVFQEYTYAWHEAFSDTLRGYPHRITSPGPGPFGIALYSQVPIASGSVITLVRDSRPSIEATLFDADRAISILGTHAPPPMSGALYDERNLHLRAIADFARRRSAPLIVAGDLNSSPWSAHFQRLLARGALYDGRVGNGILPTWPARLYALQIPIDHILVSGEFSVRSMKVSSGLGSDHKAIWARLQY